MTFRPGPAAAGARRFRPGRDARR